MKIWGDNSLDTSLIKKFLDSLERDKKNENGQVKVILTKGFGQMFLTTLELGTMMRGLLKEYFDQDLQSREL